MSQLASEREAELIERARAGDEAAVSDLLALKKGFIARVVRDIWDDPSNAAVLLGYGYMGLREALKHFDPTRGTLETFAWEWVRREVRRGVQEFTDTGWSGTDLRDRRRLRKLRRILTSELGREPTPEELATASGLAATRVRALRDVHFSSLYAEEGTGDQERAESPDHDSPAEAAMSGPYSDPESVDSGSDTDASPAALRERYEACLAVLSEHERGVFALRYGCLLSGQRPLTMEHVAKELGLGHADNARVIEAAALDRLEKLGVLRLPRA